MDETLELAKVPLFASKFVKFNVETALSTDLCEVAAVFVFGRETAVP